MLGLRSPVVRATIMSILFLIGYYNERVVNIFNIIAFSGIIILLINPLDLFNIGFQFSFCSTLGIVYFYPRLYNLIYENAIRPIVREKDIYEKSFFNRFVTQPFIASISAILGTAPFQAYYFGKIPVISIIANIFIVPLIGLVISALIPMVVTGLLGFTVLSKIFAGFVYVIVNVIFFFVRIFQNFKKLTIIWHPQLFDFLFFYMIAISFVNLKESWAKRMFVYSLLVYLNMKVWIGI